MDDTDAIEATAWCPWRQSLANARRPHLVR